LVTTTYGYITTYGYYGINTGALSLPTTNNVYSTVVYANTSPNKAGVSSVAIITPAMSYTILNTSGTGTMDIKIEVVAKKLADEYVLAYYYSNVTTNGTIVTIPSRRFVTPTAATPIGGGDVIPLDLTDYTIELRVTTLTSESADKFEMRAVRDYLVIEQANVFNNIVDPARQQTTSADATITVGGFPLV
jgi:hypothetical protein